MTLLEDTKYFELDDFDKIFIALCEGNDHATIGSGGSDGGSDGGGDRGSDGGPDDWYVSSIVLGHGGNDHLTGRGGQDTLIGGDGKDKLKGKKSYEDVIPLT